MSRVRPTAKATTSQRPSTGGKAPRSTVGGKAPRKTFGGKHRQAARTASVPEPDSDSREDAESETESDDDDGDNADLTPTQRGQPGPTAQSGEPSNAPPALPKKKGAKEKAVQEIEDYRTHREALVLEAYQNMEGRKKSKFLPNFTARRLRKQLKRIPKAIYTTQAYKTQRAAERHEQNIKNANLDQAHVTQVRQVKRARTMVASWKQNEDAVKEISQQPNKIQLWKPVTPGCPAFCAAKCDGTGNGMKGEIEEGVLMVVRHAPGPKGPDGFVPDAPMFYHIECLSSAMLARYSNPATYKFHQKLPDNERARFKTLVDQAVIDLENNPTPKKKKVNTNALSVTAFKRLKRGRTKAASNLHKAQQTWKRHATFVANNRAERLILMAKRKCEATEKHHVKLAHSKAKVVVENAELRILNDSQKNALNLYESLLSQRGRKLAFEKQMRKITRDEGHNLQKAARNQSALHFDLIFNCYQAMEQSPELRTAYTNALDEISPGLLGSHMAMLQMIADRPPGGFVTAGDNTGHTVRSYMDTILQDPVNFNDCAKNEAHLQNELKQMAKDVEELMADWNEEEEAGEADEGNEVDQLASD
ncbi:hypothetical protein BD410DRAFT_840151 [Rickenella mellea]|uniref:Uncharacterized protein n=1 Tax=Rickenella mellea TaxID=50990 RepID=A0A4Y7Q3Y0_9AGAM|nr:hypothetical protein BD410DRAFT_840151 [Rickenella mellea]